MKERIIFILYLLGKWESHADVEMVRWIQARNQTTDDYDTPPMDMYSSEYEEETYNDKQERKEATKDAKVKKSTGSLSEENYIPPVSNKFALLSTEWKKIYNKQDYVDKLSNS